MVPPLELPLHAFIQGLGLFAFLVVGQEHAWVKRKASRLAANSTSADSSSVLTACAKIKK